MQATDDVLRWLSNCLLPAADITEAAELDAGAVAGVATDAGRWCVAACIARTCQHTSLSYTDTEHLTAAQHSNHSRI